MRRRGSDVCWRAVSVQVVKTFRQADLAALLAFVWGRKRMPVPNSGDHMKVCNPGHPRDPSLVPDETFGWQLKGCIALTASVECEV